MVEAQRAPQPDAQRAGAERPALNGIVSRYRKVALRAINRRFNPRNPNSPTHKYPEEISESRKHETVQTAQRIFEEADRQGVENWQLYDSQASGLEGTRISATHVSVRELARRIIDQDQLAEQIRAGMPHDYNPPKAEAETAADVHAQKEQEEKAEPKQDEPISRRIITITPQYSPPPKGHPMELWGEVYHQVMHALPGVVREMRTAVAKAKAEGKSREEIEELLAQVPDVEIYSFGFPHSLGGKVGETWPDAIRDEGFDAYGRLYADFFRTQILVGSDGQPLSSAKNVAIQLEGNSMGGEIARATARHLETDLHSEQLQADIRGLKERKRLKVLTYVSTGWFVPDTGDPKAIEQNREQKTRGIEAEVGLHLFDGEFWREQFAEFPFLRRMKTYLKQKFPEKYSDNDGKQRDLIKKARREESNLMLRGQAPTGDVRSYEIEGEYDFVNRKVDVGKLIRAWLGERLRGRNSPVTLEQISHGSLGQNMEDVDVEDPNIEATNRSKFLLPTSHYIDYKDKRAQRWGQIIDSTLLLPPANPSNALKAI